MESLNESNQVNNENNDSSDIEEAAIATREKETITTFNKEQERPNKRQKCIYDNNCSDQGDQNNSDQCLPIPFAETFDQFLENEGHLKYQPPLAWVQPENFTVDEEGSTILITAIRNGKVQIAELLVEIISKAAKFINSNDAGTHAYPHVKYLNANVNHVNRHGALALTIAAQRGYTDLATSLVIKGGADVNAHSNANGTTALIQSSHFGNHAIVRMLLGHGALPEKANKKETTALMRASQEGHVSIVKLLLTYNANVLRRNHERMTSLMLASQRGHEQVVQVLINAGASQVLNERTSQNSTALMLACKRGHKRVVDCLMSAGAELYLRDSRGRTARDIAVRKGYKGISKELTQCLQHHLIRMKIRENRISTLIKIWHLMEKNRCLIKGTSIQHVKHMIESNKSLTSLNKDSSIIYLIQSLTLPLPLFINVAQFIQLPPAWEHLLRTIYMGRCHVDPNASIQGILDLIDEMLLESNLTDVFEKLIVPPPIGFRSWNDWKPVAVFGGSPKWPTYSALVTAQDARKAAEFFGVLWNRPKLLEVLSSAPFKMKPALLKEIRKAWDVQSLSRRLSRGVIFEPSVAMSKYMRSFTLKYLIYRANSFYLCKYLFM